MKEKLIGRFGEQAAAEYLRRKRYRIIGSNFSCRFGEIDLIAETRENLVFVEVKTRKNAAFAEAREFVTLSKQRRIAAAAELWLAKNPTEKQPRFDVVEIYSEDGIVKSIQHIENAFEI